METQTQTNEAKPTYRPIDPATLGNGYYSEKVTIDPNADAFAIAPPVPDDWYVARLAPSDDPEHPTLEFIEYPATADKPMLRQFKINFNFVLESFLDPSKDNSVLKGKVKKFDASVSTRIRQRDGLPTSEATTLLAYFGYPTPPGTDIEQIAATLNQIIGSGEARLKIKTRWKAGWVSGSKDATTGKYTYGKWLIAGQSNFPVLANGQHSPKITLNGNDYNAGAKVVEFLPLGPVAA